MGQEEAGQLEPRRVRLQEGELRAQVRGGVDEPGRTAGRVGQGQAGGVAAQGRVGPGGAAAAAGAAGLGQAGVLGAAEEEREGGRADLAPLGTAVRPAGRARRGYCGASTFTFSVTDWPTLPAASVAVT
jgi:hypothetical protein